MSMLTIAKIIEGAYEDCIINYIEYIDLCNNISLLHQKANSYMSVLDYLTLI